MGIPTTSCERKRSSISRFSDFPALEAYLDSLGMFHMDLGLGRMRSALSALDLEHPDYLSVQVVGTNGKGSTATFLTEILKATGLRPGLYTSPHFLSPCERILMDGEPLPESDWMEAAEAVLHVSEDRSHELRLTYFELITVMAAWLFQKHGCRACVFEAGLGGAHDATTALHHDLTVLTPIGLDHLSILGPTLADIARDKARAMRPGVTAVTAQQKPLVMAVLETMAAQTCTPLHTARDIAHVHGTAWPVSPSMPGPHQTDNLRLAMAAHHLLAKAHSLPLDSEALKRTALNAFIPGRLQIIPPSNGWPCFVLDGAHNQPGLECLALALTSLGMTPRAMIFACLADKDLAGMLPLVRSLADGPIIVPGMDVPGRAMDQALLAGRIGQGAEAVRDMKEAFERVKDMDGTVLVCGSLYLLAEAYKLRPEWLRRQQQE